MNSSSVDTTTFRVKALRCDFDALILLGIALALVVASLATLAFLPDAAWDRLVERSHALWVALLAIVPTLVAIHGRFKVREAGARALGETAAAVGPEIARAEVYANAAAASVQRDDLDAFEPDDDDIAEAQAFHAQLAADPTQNGPILPTGDDA